VGEIEGELVVGEVEGKYGAELGLADGAKLGILAVGELVGSPTRLQKSKESYVGVLETALLLSQPQQVRIPVDLKAHDCPPPATVMSMKSFPVGVWLTPL